MYFEFSSVFALEVSIGLNTARSHFAWFAKIDDVRCVSSVDEVLDYYAH